GRGGVGRRGGGGGAGMGPARRVAPEDAPPLGKSVREARDAFASLAERVTAKAKEQTRFWPTMTVALETTPTADLPRVTPLEKPLGKVVQSLRESGKGVSTGLQTVSNSARRAFNYFLRQLPPLQPEAKNAE